VERRGERERGRRGEEAEREGRGTEKQTKKKTPKREQEHPRKYTRKIKKRQKKAERDSRIKRNRNSKQKDAKDDETELAIVKGETKKEAARNEDKRPRRTEKEGHSKTTRRSIEARRQHTEIRSNKRRKID